MQFIFRKEMIYYLTFHLYFSTEKVTGTHFKAWLFSTQYNIKVSQRSIWAVPCQMSNLIQGNQNFFTSIYVIIYTASTAVHVVTC